MTNKERRKMRRESSRTSVRSVAAAPSYKAPMKGARRSRLRRALILSTMLAAFTALTISVPKSAHAAGNLSPEIDPGSMAGAMTLLVGGVLALTDRNRRA